MFGAFHIGVSQGTAMPVFVLRYASSFPEGQFELRCRLHSLPLPKGRYSLWGAMRAPRGSGPNGVAAVAAPDLVRGIRPHRHQGAVRGHGAVAGVRACGLGAVLTPDRTGA